FVNPDERQIIKDYLSKNIKGKYNIEVLPLDNFYDAEEYHQDYLYKNPTGYCHVNMRLIRDEEKK
ncbi:MAG: peptide-methionine (S)-S-oxide reductase, partial [Bacilli bacterium]|nr:peptide-methionine (S)-S-oxide reductase [Bacilli bacterium]